MRAHGRMRHSSCSVRNEFAGIQTGKTASAHRIWGNGRGIGSLNTKLNYGIFRGETRRRGFRGGEGAGGEPLNLGKP